MMTIAGVQLPGLRMSAVKCGILVMGVALTLLTAASTSGITVPGTALTTGFLDVEPPQGCVDFAPNEVVLKVIHLDTPAYPRLAQQAGIEGTVGLKVFVEKEGYVRRVWVERSSGVGSMDKAALRAMYQSQFEPCIEYGDTLCVWALYSVRFWLNY